MIAAMLNKHRMLAILVQVYLGWFLSEHEQCLWWRAYRRMQNIILFFTTCNSHLLPQYSALSLCNNFCASCL